MTVEDSASIAEFGVIEYKISDILLDNDTSVEALANLIAGRYAQPSLRIDKVMVETKDYSPAQVQQVIGLQLGDVVQVVFTPNNIGDPINQYLTVDAIEHSIVSGSNHKIVFDLSETSLGFVLDELVSATNASMATLTIPPNSSVAFPIGTAIAVVSYGATTCTVAEGAGVTLNSTGGASTDVVIDGQYAGVTLYKVATDSWLAIGAIQ